MTEVYGWAFWFRELAVKIAEGGEEWLIEKARLVDWGREPELLKHGDQGVDPFSFLYSLAQRNTTKQRPKIYPSVTECFGLESSHVANGGRSCRNSSALSQLAGRQLDDAAAARPVRSAPPTSRPCSPRATFRSAAAGASSPTGSPPRVSREREAALVPRFGDSSHCRASASGLCRRAENRPLWSRSVAAPVALRRCRTLIARAQEYALER